MYIYADQNGYIKEVVNDKVLRQANDNINHIYLYIENFSAASYTSIGITYKLSDDTIIGPQSIAMSSVVTKIIPYNKKRDLKFFKDYVEYTFFDIPIPDGTDPTLGNVLEHTGLVKTTIAFISSTEIFSLQIIPFYVEESVVRATYNINTDQYNYLLQLLLFMQDYVEANPTGTFTDTLRSIRIGETSYGLSASGNGGFILTDSSGATAKDYKLSLEVKSDGKCHLIAEEVI